MMEASDDLLRLDTATALRRFWHLERALLLAYAGWVPSVARLEAKAALAEAAWESSLIAEALRQRVFELRYPDRTLDLEPDAALVSLFESAVNAPDPGAFLTVTGNHLLPALGAAYERYLALSDAIADGPTHRFLQVGRLDKTRHAEAQKAAAANEAGSEAGQRWVDAIAERLQELGGVRVEAEPVGSGPVGSGPVAVNAFTDPGAPHRIPERPLRDDRYLNGLFYWPDNFDPDHPYGEGFRLQLRTALSHLNEVWAVESAGAVLFDLGPDLGWDFIMDAARWLYDESRHMTMGRMRLERWGFTPGELPLGTFIYGACAGKPSVYRLGMLAFFETKNIGKKAQRAVDFGEMGDRSGQRDMEFDWADEAIHAGYGRRWLRDAMKAQGQGDDWQRLVSECETLVARHITDASEEDRDAIRAQAAALVEKAERHLIPANGGA